MASGNTLLVFGPLNNNPPATNYATFDTRNSVPVLDFDASTDEAAVFSGVLPRHYSGGGLTLTCHCAMTSATSGNVILQAAIERMNTDEDTDSFASAQSSTATAVNGTSGIVFPVTATFTSGAQMDSLAAGEPFRLKINRDADNGSDTATGDLELVMVEVQET
jgi:hypothetical protein